MDERTLAIASSFSGNTEETLAAAEELAERGACMAAVTAGGRLAELAGERGWPLVRIPREREPKDFQPRCAVGYVVTYLARMLESAGCLPDPPPELKDLVDFLGGLDVRGAAEQAAVWLEDRVAVVYTNEFYAGPVGRTAKIKLNEHAKRPAFSNTLPEMNHNEMNGYAQAIGRFGLLYMRDPAGDPRVHRRFEVMRRVFADEGLDHVAFREWELVGETPLQRIFSGLAYGDWLSWARALLDGIDPTPVHLVESFKRALG